MVIAEAWLYIFISSLAWSQLYYNYIAVRTKVCKTKTYEKFQTTKAPRTIDSKRLCHVLYCFTKFVSRNS